MLSFNAKAEQLRLRCGRRARVMRLAAKALVRRPEPPPRLPEDLWEEIARLACVDGGYTGCSLSLTSKYIRGATRGMRFYSVSLTFRQSRLQATHFLACLEAETARCGPERTRQPLVRHLYLASPKYSAHSELSTRWEYKLAVSGILRLVAPRLHSLVLARGVPDFNNRRPGLDDSVYLPLPDFLATKPFPELRELYLVGRHTVAARDMPPFAPSPTVAATVPLPHSQATAAGGGAAPRPTRVDNTLPKLTHLEVPMHGRLPLWDWALWRARGAALTHLRITDFGTYTLDANFKHLLPLVMPVPRTRGRGGEGGFAGTAMPELQTLLVQAKPPLPRKETLYYGHSHVRPLEALHALESGPRWGLVPVRRRKDRMKMSQRLFHQERWVAEEIRDWRSRLEGGPGRWRVEEAWFEKSARC
ncbi:uncharacterized protein BXZ73DRAFT_99468 [Epithele typhae]|uniref:uncharacterized protein n=1 Tax=Epithele typhae TaxID=378194 RepID=UPI0020078BE9|nr:uncharacterized protein BXZ73DRAFT_99468 [Epithele typhae]KAH9939265.1 hypothetical protein BXZ73DRAFT_99468 [Epithele typhae]